MTEMADLFAGPPAVEWIIGKVERITGSTFSMSYRGGRIDGVGTLDHYTPAVGDVVHCLSLEGQGVIALGSNNQATVTDPPTSTLVDIVVPNAALGWVETDQSWLLTGPATQTPDQAIVWEYPPGDLADQVWMDLSVLEIELLGEPGQRAELFLHAQTGTGDPVDVQQTWVTDPLPAGGGPSWVRVPLGWGAELALGRSAGIGLGLNESGLTTNFTGTGRLRFTSIPGPSSS